MQSAYAFIPVGFDFAINGVMSQRLLLTTWECCNKPMMSAQDGEFDGGGARPSVRSLSAATPVFRTIATADGEDGAR